MKTSKLMGGRHLSNSQLQALLSTIMTTVALGAVLYLRRASAFQHTGRRYYLKPHQREHQVRCLMATPGPLAASTSQLSGQGFAKNSNDNKNKGNNNDNWKVVDVPLVFVPGMKGTHLAFEEDDANKKKKRTRAWLTLSNLLNFPPKPDGYFERDLSLPLTYDSDGRQHRGPLVPDGIVDHIIEFGGGSSSDGNDNDATKAKNFVDLNFLPFYGHTTRLLKEMDRQYHLRKQDGVEYSTETFIQRGDDETTTTNKNKGIFDRVGRFVERTSNWGFANTTNATADEQEALHHPHKHCRPTAVFTYDWRRSLPELSNDLHIFCEETFPNQPVQILAHR